jgi:hypothetical protein
MSAAFMRRLLPAADECWLQAQRSASGPGCLRLTYFGE